MSYLLDIFFPHTCPGCYAPLEEEESVCTECIRHIPRTEQALNRDNMTEQLFASLHHFKYGGCWLHYTKKSFLQYLILRSKFNDGNPLVFRQLGRMAAEEWIDTGFFEGIDVLVPIPLHKSRMRERGFNQSEWICRGLSDVLDIPMDTSHLTREKATKHQSRSSFEERMVGVKKAFQINHPEEWYDKTIMLVDDIITTGSTIREAIETMKDVYGCKIVVFGLAKTK